MKAHWYTLSWALFGIGLLTADLDMAFKWKDWLNKRSLVRYPLVIFFALLAFGSTFIDLVSMLKPINFSTMEPDIHPEAFGVKAKRHTTERTQVSM